MSIVVTGSLAFDHIMDFPGHFKEHILPEKVHVLNVSFLVNSLKRQPGGCASNIAYNLALLGEPAAIMGTVGTDFVEYRLWLEREGIETSLIKVIEGELTASCFITTDKADCQISGFYPGAMGHAHTLSFKDVELSSVDLAIISPNDPTAMLKYARECQELGIPYVFDPGQQIIALNGEELLAASKGAKALIGNDYEFELLVQKTGLSLDQVVELAEMVVITKGEEGSVIKTREQTAFIPPAKPRQVVDPTGAGDAYRGGILKGLVKGYGLEQMGKIASLAGTYAVEEYGTLRHRYNRGEFEARFAENFGPLGVSVW